MWIDPKTLAPVAAALEKSGYQQFASPGDRHGSWEWSFCRVSGGLTRFVILAATPAAHGDKLEMELWIGAEADQRFTRRRVESLKVRADALPALAEDLSVRAERAASKANLLSRLDLEDYPGDARPRARATA
jgi:hypothetical protein